MTEKSKRGRPKRDSIDVLRTKVWFHAVKAMSGLPSACAIESKLEPDLLHDDEDGLVRSSKWISYQMGARVPRRIKDKSYAVDVAEVTFPGTADYFNSPLWDVLRGVEVDEKWINNKLGGLGSAVTNVLLESSNNEDRRIDSRQNHRRFNEDLLKELIEIRSFQALSALVLLAKKSELIRSQEMRSLLISAYIRCQSWAKKLPGISPVEVDFFFVVDRQFNYWIHTSPDTKLDIYISTFDLLDVVDSDFQDAASAQEVLKNMSDLLDVLKKIGR
ncbi:hypothetical protein LMORI2_15170 [Limnohabitans sp. MORI2]|uniref:hypothetical protein n=1 Tax=Limnohabitans sp. MORI2 TaxID=1751150 RepID=UPI002377B598|nr:hypothetical protein [Limnohabitans sp. MORI2]BDU58535.1 hypothetical protein LMORI2_15170 [Limnohabitans sp. MORI2]